MREKALHPAYHDYQPIYGDEPYSPQTPNQTFYHPPRMGPHQTPFTQFAKPGLPDDWYQNQQQPHAMQNMQPGFQPMMQQYPAVEHQPNEAPLGNMQPVEDNLSSGYNPNMQGNLYYEQHLGSPNYSSMQANHMNPNAADFPKKQNSFIAQFQNTDGQIDVDKMIGTVGQLASTYHQIAPIIKQFSSFMKNFR